MQRFSLYLFFMIVLTACHMDTLPLKSNFNSQVVPHSPDYNQQRYWASLPDIDDAADSIPFKSNLRDEQDLAKADVFFIYPTIFTATPSNQSEWNADVNDVQLNHRIQVTTILNQASVFNGSCRIYSPYYRQANLYAFFTPNSNDRNQALEVAYQDVKAAFEYYLKHFNHGRPIVIASHSQGSYHGERLLKEFFDGKDLHKRLVAAYLVGFPIKRDAFSKIQASEAPDQVGVWASWNTFGRNHFPENYDKYFKEALCTNPLLWNSSEDFAAKDLNHGGVGLHFTFAPHLVDAQNHSGLLWIHKPYVKCRWSVASKTWHRADINFFYMNIRENVALRIERYFENQPVMAVSQTRLSSQDK